MRILHTNMLRGWGGQSNRILTEARGTLAAGHEVAFAIPHDSQLAGRGAAAGIEVWPGYAMKPPAQFWRFLPDLKRFLAGLRRWKPDLIHVHGSQDTWLAAAAKTVLGKECPPLVRTKHNTFPWSQHAGNRWLYNRIDAFVSISRFIDRQIAEYPGLSGRPRACIFSVPDLERLDGETPPFRPALKNLPENAFLWGSTGRLRPEKGFDILLPAVARLRERHPEVHLVIAGDGSEAARLKSLAGELGLLPHGVTFLGFRKDVPAILKDIDGYVLASRSEGLGTAILEALAAGAPVVASNVGGIPDSVRHEQTGLLVEPEDAAALAEAMNRMMGDDALRRRLAQNARRMIREEFTEAELIRKTNEFYESVIARAR